MILPLMEWLDLNIRANYTKRSLPLCLKRLKIVHLTILQSKFDFEKYKRQNCKIKNYKGLFAISKTWNLGQTYNFRNFMNLFTIFKTSPSSADVAE